MIYYLIGELSQYTLIEGCYIPFDWSKSFTKDYLEHIEYYCLVMSEHYIKNNFANIRKYANAIENRLDDESCTMENVLNDNARFLELAQKYGVNYILIDEKYEYFDTFASLLNHPKSLVRNRALYILAANAQWNDENRFDTIIDDYLAHVTDENPLLPDNALGLLHKLALQNHNTFQKYYHIFMVLIYQSTKTACVR